MSMWETISLITDMVGYAVINNFMGTIGSNGAVYECDGNETRLSDCMIEYGVINDFEGSGSVTYECESNETDCIISSASQETPSQKTPCHYALVDCFPKTQVFVAQTNHYTKYGYYLTVQEADGNMRVCLQTNSLRVVTEPLHVHVETTHTNTTGNTHMAAIGRHVHLFGTKKPACNV